MSDGNGTAQDLIGYIKSRSPILWIVTPEERRIERILMGVAQAVKADLWFWSCTKGYQDALGDPAKDAGADTLDPLPALQLIERAPKRRLYVLRDFHRFLNRPVDIVTIRTLRDLARSLRMIRAEAEQRMVVILSPTVEVPLELQNDIIVLRWPLPKRADIELVLDGCIKVQPAEVRETVLEGTTRDAVIDAAIGLPIDAVGDSFARSIAVVKRLDPKLIAKQKQQAIARDGILEWMDVEGSLATDLGGYDRLKRWLMQRRLGFTQEAVAFGVEKPRGIFLVGWPGSGKTATAKLTAATYGMPLIRFDVGRVMAKYVGDTQNRMRQALETIFAVAPVVLLMDEVEKMFKGVTGSGESDSGLKAEVFGMLLTALQERPKDAAPVMVTATSNDITALPPEFYRRGRFDAIFAVMLPNRRERREILTVHLRKRRRDPETIDLDQVASAMEGYSGAEIESVIVDALYRCFVEGKRDLKTEDLVEAAEAMKPLSRTAADKLKALVDWVEGRATLASDPDDEESAVSGAVDTSDDRFRL